MKSHGRKGFCCKGTENNKKGATLDKQLLESLCSCIRD